VASEGNTCLRLEMLAAKGLARAQVCEIRVLTSQINPITPVQNAYRFPPTLLEIQPGSPSLDDR
jgi:hypothetical protein